MGVSLIFFLAKQKEVQSILQFDDNTFFFVCLPPIVFASGFNMQRGNFFANIKNIILFGMVTTFFCFFMFSTATIYLKDLGFMMQFEGEGGESIPLVLTSKECLLMCSLLCSSDVVAAISLIDYNSQPKLFSIVFGEGIINDAVSIILFNTVQIYTSQKTEIDWKAPFEISVNFVKLLLDSVMLGLFFALFSSYLLKNYRAFSKNAVGETTIIFCFAYIAYLTSEVTKASGIITLLTTGIVMAHYTWYNLSPQGKQSSFIVYQFLGYVTEAFVFSYLGITFFSYQTYTWSFHLFWVELAIIIICRFIGTVGMFTGLKMCGYKAGISLKELLFIWYAGMIRGAIAFGLVLRIDSPNKEVIVTTSLALVVFTTVIFGSTVGVFSDYLFKSTKTIEESDNNYEKAATQDQLAGNESVDESSASDESYEEIIHPNAEQEDAGAGAGEGDNNSDIHKAESAINRGHKKHRYKGCAKYLHRFDEMIMKPLFIYNYERKQQKKSQEFFRLFQAGGDEIEKDYALMEERRQTMIVDAEGSTSQHTYVKKKTIAASFMHLKDQNKRTSVMGNRPVLSVAAAVDLNVVDDDENSADLSAEDRDNNQNDDSAVNTNIQ